MPETKLGPFKYLAQFLKVEVPVETSFFTRFISELTILVRAKYLPFGLIPFLTHLKHR